MGTSAPSAPISDRLNALQDAPENPETRLESGFPGTRPAGFEPATSASGGRYTIEEKSDSNPHWERTSRKDDPDLAT
jgi:hypothetical protein